MEIWNLSVKVLDATPEITHTKRMRKVRIDRHWRKELTPEERVEVTRLEREITKIERQVLALRNERKKIQNRATVRAGK